MRRAGEVRPRGMAAAGTFRRLFLTPFLLGIGLLPLSACAQPAPGSSLPCTVGRVIDGDTLECADGRRVRLLLIDTPELGQGSVGATARDVLRELAAPGTEVSLGIDVDPIDRYGRTLAYVVLPDGRMANEELLRAGVAVVAVYPPNVRHVERFREVADQAREAGRGLWATDGFGCLPAEYRAGECDGP